VKLTCTCVGAALALSLTGFVGCNDGDDPAPRGGNPTTDTGADTGSPEPTPGDRPVGRLQVRTVPAEGSEPSEFASDGRLEGAGIVQLTLAPPESNATSSEATVSIERSSPDELRVTSRPRGGGRIERSTVELSDPGLKIDRLIYKCGLPNNTFCPLRQVKRRGGDISVKTGDTRIPVSLLLSFAKTDAPVGLAELGPKAPGSPIDAEIKVTTVASETRKEATPSGPSTEAGADERVVAVVRTSPESPAGGVLRIAVPRSSGSSIEVQAGGTRGAPASTAKINATKGRIRVADLSYSCQLPPETFCPLKKIRRTPTGLLLELPTPRVPVSLIFTVARF